MILSMKGSACAETVLQSSAGNFLGVQNLSVKREIFVSRRADVLPSG